MFLFEPDKCPNKHICQGRHKVAELTFVLFFKKTCFVEELPAGTFFKLKDGRVFKRESLLRKRYKCKEMSTGNYYLFSPVHEVERIAEASIS